MANANEDLSRVLAAYVTNHNVPLDAFKEMIAPLVAAATGGSAPVAAAVIAQSPASVALAKAALESNEADESVARAIRSLPPEKPKRDPKSEQEIAESVGQHHIVSFIDGRPYKTLRRHIGANGMTEMEYKSYYGLPNDYPMVAPSYSQARSQMSKDLGLGRPRKNRENAEELLTEEEIAASANEADWVKAQSDFKEKEAERKASAKKPKAAKAAPKATEDSEQPDV
ncbi:MucR family transcriptional regulator [Aureimonas altamirensis]|uniref:MucR family transcriptional regulator n=1 Tax=Aureimonas altamirensis TaxID=370622 RepID=UPI0030163744